MSKFKNIKHFNEYDNWGNINKVSNKLIETLDNLQSKLPNAFKVLIAPDKYAVYYEIDKDERDVKKILHSMGLAAKIFISGSKSLSFITMLQINEIANITVNPYEKWKEKNLICSFDIDVRAYDNKNKLKTIDYIDGENNICNCTNNYINLCELMDLLVYIDSKQIKRELSNIGVK